MAVVYRYVDLHDEIIKYVGIVWSENRTLAQRAKEHYENDEWCKDGCWRVEYLQREVKSRIDAELLEAHYISEFKTNEWYNVSKANWGSSELLPKDENEEWKEFDTFGEIAPSDMITRFEEGFVSMWFNQKDELRISLKSKDEQKRFNWYAFADPALYENPNICIPSIDLCYAYLHELGLCSDFSSFKKVFKDLIEGKEFTFSQTVECEMSEVTGDIIRIKVGEIECIEGKIVFTSINHFLDDPSNYYTIPVHQKEKYDDFSLKDLEEAFGLFSEEFAEN